MWHYHHDLVWILGILADIRDLVGSALPLAVASNLHELTAGQSVTLKGIVRSFNGQKILIVRELTINQQTTQVRSEHGIATPLVDASAAQGNRPRGKNAVAGGAQ